MNLFRPALDRSSSATGEVRDVCRRIRLDRLIAVAAVLFAQRMQVSANQAADLKLPPAVRQALEENARQLSPISVKCTLRTDTGKLRVTSFVDGKMVSAQAMPGQLVRDQSLHVVWQEQKFYLAQRFLPGKTGATQPASLWEFTFDGRVFSVGEIPDRPGEANVGTQTSPAKTRQNGKSASPDPYRRNLFKEPVARALRMQSTGIGDMNPYFRPRVGLVLSPDPHPIYADGKIVEQKLRADSAILNSLRNGRILISVENVTLDGRPCVRIELDATDPVGRDSAPNGPVEDRKLNGKTAATQPEARRSIYHLDPSLHYAVRRLERRIGPDILLDRTDCSQFEQISGRQLWLPRRVESELHELPTLPGTVFKEVVTQILEVSAFDGSRVSDETFALNYNQPETIVHNGADPASAQSQRGQIRDAVPSRPENPPGVIERARIRRGKVNLGGGLPPAAEPSDWIRRNEALFAIVLCNVAMIGAGAGYLVLRRQKGDSA
jgi:hypothetical protein